MDLENGGTDRNSKVRVVLMCFYEVLGICTVEYCDQV